MGAPGDLESARWHSHARCAGAQPLPYRQRSLLCRKVESRFRVEHTETCPFFLSDGREKQLSFIRRPSDRGIYRSGSLYEGAVIPYRLGSRYSQTKFGILLPRVGTTPEDLLASLDVDRFFHQPQQVDLDFRMPKFTVRYSASLRPALERMGMGLAFRYPEADFKPMGSPEFVMDSVLHQSRLDLDEEGTVAAAATISRVFRGAAREREFERRELVIDRPFALLIRDSSGAILFAGVVYDPKPL